MFPFGPIERFLTFVLISSHNEADIADVLLKFLSQNSVDIKECRMSKVNVMTQYQNKHKFLVVKKLSHNH